MSQSPSKASAPNAINTPAPQTSATNANHGTTSRATTPASPSMPTSGSAAKRTASGDSKPCSPTHTPAGNPAPGSRAASPTGSPAGKSPSSQDSCVGSPSHSSTRSSPSSPRATPESPASGTAGVKRCSSGEVKTPSPTWTPSLSPPESPRLKKRHKSVEDDTTSIVQPAPGFSTPPTPQGVLGNVPIEVLEDVMKQLPWNAALALSHTNKYHRDLVQPMQYFGRLDHISFMQHAEQRFFKHLNCGQIKKRRRRGNKGQLKGLPDATPHAGSYACYTCMRLRPTRDFAFKQVKGPRGKGNAQQQRRFCIPCGERENLYTTGAVIKRAGGGTTPLRRCKSCRVFKDGTFCARCHLCQDCIELSADHKNPHCPACGKQDCLKRQFRAGAFGAAASAEEPEQGAAAADAPCPDRDGGKRRRST